MLSLDDAGHVVFGVLRSRPWPQRVFLKHQLVIDDVGLTRMSLRRTRTLPTTFDDPCSACVSERLWADLSAEAPPFPCLPAHVARP